MCPLCWSPFSLPLSRHLFLPFLPSKNALFCRAKGTVQRLERGSFGMDLPTNFGKEIPSRNPREKRSVVSARTVPCGFCKVIFRDPLKIPFKISIKIIFQGYFYLARLFLFCKGKGQKHCCESVSGMPVESVQICQARKPKESFEVVFNIVFKNCKGIFRDPPKTSFQTSTKLTCLRSF